MIWEPRAGRRTLGRAGILQVLMVPLSCHHVVVLESRRRGGLCHHSVECCRGRWRRTGVGDRGLGGRRWGGGKESAHDMAVGVAPAEPDRVQSTTCSLLPLEVSGSLRKTPPRTYRCGGRTHIDVRETRAIFSRACYEPVVAASA